MEAKIKITAVSYLNTKPFIYGLFRSNLADHIDLSLDIPSVCAQKLQNGEAELALMPVAAIPDLGEAWIVSDYCIGSTGKVKTVCVFSERPLREIKKIYLDFHSRTSVQLVQILCAHYWKITPEFISATEGFEQHIQGDTAAVIIGDRTVGKDLRFPFVYDLGEAWTQWTGLPFVFAAWVSKKPLSTAFLAKFNEALEFGIQHLPELVKVLPAMSNLNLDDYFRHNISYHLDEGKWNAINRFLGYLASPDQYVLHHNVRAATV